MGFTVLQRRISAWLALLALVLGGLSPALTQALAAGTERAGWVQICTASGMSWVQIDAQADAGGAMDAQTSDVAGAASSGCTWCQHHGVAGLPPPALALPLVSGPVPQAAPMPRTAALAPWWPAALGRAPPTHV